MKKTTFLKRIGIAGFLFASVSAACAQENRQEVEFVSVTPMAQSINEAERELARLEGSGILNNIEFLSLGAGEDNLFKIYVRKMNGLKKNPYSFVKQANPKHTYQLILQPGHYWRVKGITGAQGKVAERNYVAFLVSKIYKILKKKGVDVIVIPADGNKHISMHADIFLSIHADGSTKKCSSKPSIGYHNKSDVLGVHALGYALAASLGYDYRDFHKDNYTNGLAKYYMFNRVSTTKFEGLLEIGEMTCPKQEKQMVLATDTLARNLSSMLYSMLTLKEFR